MIGIGVETGHHQVGDVVGHAFEAGTVPFDGAEQEGRHRLAGLGSERRVPGDECVERGAE